MNHTRIIIYVVSSWLMIYLKVDFIERAIVEPRKKHVYEQMCTRSLQDTVVGATSTVVFEKMVLLAVGRRADLAEPGDISLFDHRSLHERQVNRLRVDKQVLEAHEAATKALKSCREKHGLTVERVENTLDALAEVSHCCCCCCLVEPSGSKFYSYAVVNPTNTPS